MFIPTWALILIGILVIFYARRSKNNFEPFMVTVRPKWSELVEEYKLDGSSWDRQISAGEYSLIRDGVTFTVLKPNLTYFNGHHSFHTRLNLKLRIGESNNTLHFVGLCVKEGLDGYDLAISTPASREKSIHPMDDRDGLKITTIPFTEFKLPANKNASGEKLKKYGWIKEVYPDFETIDLEHKYFDVSYKWI